MNEDISVTTDDVAAAYLDHMIEPIDANVFLYYAEAINHKISKEEKPTNQFVYRRDTLTDIVGTEHVEFMDRLLEIVFDANKEFGDDAEQFLGQVGALNDIIKELPSESY